MSQNITNSAANNLSPPQNQMSMPNRMPQSQLGTLHQQPSWSSSYYGQPSQSPYMNPYMPHGAPNTVPSHNSMSQPPLTPLGQKPPSNASDRTRAAYPPHSNLYSQSITTGTPSSYYGYDPYYNQVSADPYLTHSSPASAPHWSAPNPANSMMNANSNIAGGSGSIPPRAQASGSSNIIPQSQGTSAALPPISTRPPPPSQTPDRNQSAQLTNPEILMSYDRQRNAPIVPQSQHPSAILSQSMSSPGANTLSPTQQMNMQNRMQPQNQLGSINQQPSWSSSYYSQNQSPYMNPYLPHGNGGVVATGHSSSMTQPPASIPKQLPNGNDRTSSYPSHSNLYAQPGSTNISANNYYGYDQSYGQIPPDSYPTPNSANNSHWPTPPSSSSILNNGPAPVGSMQSQLRPQSNANVQNIQSQPLSGTNTALTTLGPRSAMPSQTSDRSPSLSTSYPSPNQQTSTAKPGSNSLAQLEQMVMPGNTQPNSLKSPTHRSTTSSPSASTHQTSTMQYSYNSGGQGNYFSPGANQSQASYYPYENPDNVDPTKSAWSEQSTNSAMNAQPPSGSMDAGSFGQGYDSASGYGDYTQLSTPSQPRFPINSDMSIEQNQIDKNDPYAIDSQTFEDNDDSTSSAKTKKSRAKKGDDSNKKERRQRGPRASKTAIPVIPPAPTVNTKPSSPNTNNPLAQTTTTQHVNQMPDLPPVPSEIPERVISPIQCVPSTKEEYPDKESVLSSSEIQESTLKPQINSSIPTESSLINSRKSPLPSSGNSTSTPVQPVQYPYTGPPQDNFNFNQNLSANSDSYYNSYETSSNQEASKPIWSDQRPTSILSTTQNNAATFSGGSAQILGDIDKDKGYNQYTQLSAPEQSQSESSNQINESEMKIQTADTIPVEKDDLSSTPKTKKSRSKKSDDPTKKERKPRPSRALKAQNSQHQSPITSPPIVETVAQVVDECTQLVQQIDQSEQQKVSNEGDANETQRDPDTTPKPKRSRPKKTSDKTKRPSRAAPKQPTAEPDQPIEISIPQEILEQPSISANDSIVEGQEQEQAALDTTPAKPKRIRIRDSSSKGKKKLPKFALKFAKTKKRKRLGSSDNEQSDMEKTPPPSPDEDESGVQKRRSARNTKKLKYNDDIELGFSESDDDSQPSQSRKKPSVAPVDGDVIDESAVAEEPTVFAAPVEDTMVVEKIMASRMGKRELEPEPGEVLPPDGTFIDIEEFYVKYKNMSYLHCDWRTLEELERGDRRVVQKVKRYKQKKDNSNLFSFMDEELFDPQYCEVDRILAVNEVEELVPASDDEADPVKEVENLQKSVDNTNLDLLKTNNNCAIAISTDISLEDSQELKDTPIEEKSDRIDADSAENKDVTCDKVPSQSTIGTGTSTIKIDNSETINASIDGTSTSVDETIVVQASVDQDDDQRISEKPKKMKKKVSRHYLVKWRSLTYEDSTWELEEHLDPDKIKHFERFKDPPPKSKWKSVKRPKPEEWVRKEVSPVYKNNNTLREYQLEGINWLSFCWHQGRNCILADEMGLGKTIQSIAFVNEIYEKGIYGPFLIIVPLSTVGNWAREFETWTDLNVITYHGGSTSREMLKEYEMFYRNEQGNRITQVYKFQVMITTFEIILSDCLDLMKIPWRCCIIDEAHRLKNRNCKLLEGLRLLNMEHRVLLTGTPLQNNVEELFSLLNFLEPTQFSSTEQFLLEFGDLKTEAQVDKLKLILKPMMLRRLKEDVEKTLAPKEETIVEVELTNIQKKYYRAILERNFSFLQKGSTSNNMPNLMNTMMELRKCCIHPYLINGAEEQILYEARQTKLADGISMSSHQAMINASGKLVLLDKLLPRLRADGHRVLIFSQMVRCLDILEDYVTHKQYPFERIDGRVRGSDRQQAIDRYSKPGSDRFVFLLCTRAGGLGINLTAADTVIIFDSDWNPQNDLQAQARCHRIGQSKAVKIYRLICRNTYEREMFDKASLKLGLDKAVLQSMNTQKAAGMDGQLTKKEIEELLRKGAYGALMDDDNAGDKFCEEDIDQILSRRTQVITIESTEAKGSTFSKATFSSSNNREDIELDDPDFWEKWAKKANIDPDDLLTKEELVQLAPRRRTQTKRYGADGNLIEMSDLESSEEDEETISMRTRGSRRGNSKQTPSSSSKRTKRQKFLDDDDDELAANIDGGYWSKNDCLKIESGLLTYGWSRWSDIISNHRFKRDISVEDCENICRVILLYCLNTYKGDEKIKSFVWELITPSEKTSKAESDLNNSVSTRGRKPKSAPIILKRSVAEEISDAQWPKEAQNDPLIALPDDQYRRHLQRNCNRLLVRVKFLHYLKYDILKGYDEKIHSNCDINDIDIPPVPVDGELPAPWWDDEADRSLLVGIYKHGHDNFNLIRQDPSLCFLHRCGPPSNRDLNAELNNKSIDYIEEDSKAYINLKKTAAGACLHELLNNVVRDLTEEFDTNDKTDDIIDENKNTILKCGDISGSLDILCESGAGESSQTIKMDATDDDSLLNENSTDTTLIDKTISNDTKLLATEDNIGFFLFPTANDLNQRFRRLITAYQRNSKKIEIQLAQKARDELKKERTSKYEAARNEREERRRSQAQRWSRREEGDFVKAISFFGVEYDPKTKKHDWNKFRLIGKLDKKMDETLEDYYRSFVIMCKKVTSQPLTEEEESCSATIETIAEDRAAKCLSRIEFFSKIRINVINHPELDIRLKLCQSQSDLPDWWQNGIHDKDLLIAAAKHGLYRLDYNLAHDPTLCFETIIRERVENLFANPPSSILIPLDQLQELLERNGVEYLKDTELDDQSEVIKAIILSIIDSIDPEDSDDKSDYLRVKSTRNSFSRSNSRRGANTIVKSVESKTSSNCIKLTSLGDSCNSDRRVAEVTPIMPDKIPDNLKKTHEAGEVTITIQSESVLLKLDDKPPIVLTGALNPIVMKIRWPKDKAMQTRLDNLINLVENNEWPTSKSSIPTITLPSHLTTTPINPTIAPSSTPTLEDVLEVPPAPGSPSSDAINAASSGSSHQENKDRTTDVPVTRGRRGKGRKLKQPEPDPYPQIDSEQPAREDRDATAKLRNLLSQTTSTTRSSTLEKSSSKSNDNEKQGSNLSSLLATFKHKKGESSGSSRSREGKRTDPVEPNIPNPANLLPQILANMKPEFRDLLANPEAASLLMNSLNSFPGLGNLGNNLRTSISTHSPVSSDNPISTQRSTSKSHRSDRTKTNDGEKMNNSGLSSLLANFKQQKNNASTRGRDDQNIAGPSGIIPQLLANMKPEFRDLLANPDAASILMNSLGGLTGSNFNSNPLQPSIESKKSLSSNPLQERSSVKGPPPAHQRSDNVPSAHGSTTRELRRNSQSTRDTSNIKTTRARSSLPDMSSQDFPKVKSDDATSRSSSKKRGRPSSSVTENNSGLPTGADILDLSSLQPSRKGNSLLRSESRTRRNRDQPDISDEVVSVATRSSSGSSKPSSKVNSKISQPHELDQHSNLDPERGTDQRSDKPGRSTRASKRIGSRIDALALNLQAKRLNVSDSPEPSPNSVKEKSHDNQLLAHGSTSKSSNYQKHHSSKAPPVAHSGTIKTSSTRDHHRHRDKDKYGSASTSSSISAATTNPPTTTNRPQDPLAQFISKMAPNTSSLSSSLTGQPPMSTQASQDPLTQLMSNPASFLANLNPGPIASTSSNTNDLMNQLLRKAGSNDFVKNLLGEFVKNPSLASMDPSILATLTAGMSMNPQTLPNFNLPSTAATSLPYGNFTNPLANPFLSFNMANLGMNNPLSNPLGMFPNLYMPTGFPQQQQQQPQQQHQHQQQQPLPRQQPNQSSGTSEGGPKDKKMRYSRK